MNIFIYLQQTLNEVEKVEYHNKLIAVIVQSVKKLEDQSFQLKLSFLLNNLGNIFCLGV